MEDFLRQEKYFLNAQSPFPAGSFISGIFIYSSNLTNAERHQMIRRLETPKWLDDKRNTQQNVKKEEFKLIGS